MRRFELRDLEASDVYRYLIERGDVQAKRDRALPHLALLVPDRPTQSDVVRVKLSDFDEVDSLLMVTSKTGAVVPIAWSDDLRACVEEANRLWPRKGRIYLFESTPRGQHAKRGSARAPRAA